MFADLTLSGSSSYNVIELGRREKGIYRTGNSVYRGMNVPSTSSLLIGRAYVTTGSPPLCVCSACFEILCYDECRPICVS